MRRAALLLAFVSATVQAQPPRTKWGVLTGGRAITGDLSDRYGLGFVLGFEGTFMPDWFGLGWSLQYTWFWGQSDPRNVETLQLIDLDVGARARIVVTNAFPIFVWVQAGVGLVRASVPLGDELQSSYIGPVAGLGVELAMWSPLVISANVDFSYLGSGPSGIRALVSIALASH